VVANWNYTIILLPRQKLGILPGTPAPDGPFVWPRHGPFAQVRSRFTDRMAPIDVALTQSLGTVKALSVVAMAKPFCGHSTNEQKCYRGERALI